MSTKIRIAITIILIVLTTILLLGLGGFLTVVFTLNISKQSTNNIKHENQTIMNMTSSTCQCGCPTIRPEITPRIVNGEPAILNSWPWQLLLINFSYEGIPQYYCGASLLTPKHVLTAAHCVFGLSPRYVGVIPRVHDFNRSTWSRTSAYLAESVFTHESFDDRTGNHDVAVIRLLTPIVLDDYVSPICLASGNTTNEPLKAGDELVAIGWGSIEGGNRSKPDVLQQVRLKFVPSSDPSCAPLVGRGDSVRPGQMCAGFPPRAICFGDSGGPLLRSVTDFNGQIYWQQVGIMSGTVDCGHKTNFSDVYTSVSYYNRWILEKINAQSS